ncbi:cyclophilin-like fold protein [Tolumonas auensis]|uniref:cyclophilin-like fold protein n=1 Tax=Tolumonas auensis TaxID=43948 RepID=UPI002AA8D03E|nr:cyclophilin-like fold protein [Tolumonas auensis]
MEQQRLVIQIKNAEFEVALYDNPSAEKLVSALPLSISMSKWGGEYYGALPVPIPANGKKTELFAEGEVALWPDGNGFCIFFGPTPVSTDDRPRMASPGIAFGKITSDLAALHQLGDSLREVKLFLRN